MDFLGITKVKQLFEYGGVEEFNALMNHVSNGKGAQLSTSDWKIAVIAKHIFNMLNEDYRKKFNGIAKAFYKIHTNSEGLKFIGCKIDQENYEKITKHFGKKILTLSIDEYYKKQNLQLSIMYLKEKSEKLEKEIEELALKTDLKSMKEERAKVINKKDIDSRLKNKELYLKNINEKRTEESKRISETSKQKKDIINAQRNIQKKLEKIHDLISKACEHSNKS